MYIINTRLVACISKTFNRGVILKQLRYYFLKQDGDVDVDIHEDGVNTI